MIYMGQEDLIVFLLSYASWYGSILLKEMLASFLDRQGVVYLLLALHLLAHAQSICLPIESHFCYDAAASEPITTLDKQLSS